MSYINPAGLLLIAALACRAEICTTWTTGHNSASAFSNPANAYNAPDGSYASASKNHSSNYTGYSACGDGSITSVVILMKIYISNNFTDDYTTIQANVGGSELTHNIIYAGCRNGLIYVLDAHTGDSLDIIFNGSIQCSSPLIHDSLIIYGAGGWAQTIEANSIATTYSLWAHSNKQILYFSPAVADNIVVYGDNSGSLTALDFYTGQRKWRYRTGGTYRRVFHRPGAYGSDQCRRPYLGKHCCGPAFTVSQPAAG
jgi:outer membrane protein assembly factor BamB